MLFDVICCLPRGISIHKTIKFENRCVCQKKKKRYHVIFNILYFKISLLGNNICFPLIDTSPLRMPRFIMQAKYEITFSHWKFSLEDEVQHTRILNCSYESTVIIFKYAKILDSHDAFIIDNMRHIRIDNGNKTDVIIPLNFLSLNGVRWWDGKLSLVLSRMFDDMSKMRCMGGSTSWKSTAFRYLSAICQGIF